MAKGAIRLYTLPSGCSFGDQLAAGLLQRYRTAPEDLASVRLLLPTRRACRTMQEAFLRQTGGKPLLLPHMQPLGDVDEVELGLHTAGMGEMQLSLPRPLSPLRRQTVLARMLQHVGSKSGDENKTFSYYFALADSLGGLLDEMQTEGVGLSAFQTLVSDENLNAHWQMSLRFLRALEETWPDWLAAEKAVDPAWRRRELMLALNRFWLANPPQYPVIIAGTTGTIPATTALLKTVAQLPQGEIILPGFDLGLDAASWDAVQEGHPQYTLKVLLSHMRTTRDAVTLWPDAADEGRACEALWRDVMRPPETTTHWQTPAHNAATCMEHIALCEAETPEQEALVIALAMRDVLQQNNHKTAALVTPDRQLAARVRAALGRWDIALDDSAGTPLLQTLQGQFLDAIVQTAQTLLAPLPVLRLLRHPFCANGTTANACLALAAILDGPSGYRPLYDDPKPLPSGHALLAETLAPLTAIARGFHAPVTFLNTLLQTAENLATTSDMKGAEVLWQGDAGEELARMVTEWLGAMDMMPPITLADFITLITQLMQQASIRPRLPGTPRLRILGQLEARLQQADLMILGGLNEGTWPAEAKADPWLSRQMRRQIGLPVPERQLTLSAHDFVQAASAGQVLLTRSRHGVDGNPATPSRWLQRLEAVCELQQLPDPRRNGDIWLFHAQMLDMPDVLLGMASEPKPTPPLPARRHKLSISDVGTWINDPYALYAKRILGLRIWPDIGVQETFRVHGNHLHQILDSYTKDRIAYPHAQPLDLFRQAADKHGPPPDSDPAAIAGWQVLIERVGAFLADHEQARLDASWRPVAAEIAGQLSYAGFTIDGRADRIDRNGYGELCIIDYKARTSPYPTSELGTGHRPQLGLEALFAMSGAWDNLPKAEVAELQYWLLGQKTGGTVADATAKNQTVADFTQLVRDGLTQLAEHYLHDATQPYLSQPFGIKLASPEYTYLSRFGEWSLQGDDEAEDAA